MFEPSPVYSSTRTLSSTRKRGVVDENSAMDSIEGGFLAEIGKAIFRAIFGAPKPKLSPQETADRLREQGYI
jgi:hypothetical protein